MDSGFFSYRPFDNGEGHLPPGFRFHPTDEELIVFYLLKKVLDGCFTARAIAEVDLNKCEPWELPGKAKMGEKEWYFFSLRDRKYPTGLRTNRATGGGYWKATGKDREIFSSKTGSLVGMKKTLVFYKGRAPKGEKTNWVVHEFRLEGKFAYHYISRSSKDEWVISRVFQKSGVVVGSKKTRCGVAIVTSQEALSPCASLQLPLIRSNDPRKEGNKVEHVSCFSTIDAVIDEADCNYDNMSVLSSLRNPANGIFERFAMNADICAGLYAQPAPSTTLFHGSAAPMANPWLGDKEATEFDCMWS